MKEKIKEILRENTSTTNKNSLNVDVTRASQILYVLRGVSGSGKSTKAKSLVSEGIIHSTDSVIERHGDYDEFFRVVNETNNTGPLSKMHSINLKEAIESMKNGLSPVVIDNTNLTMLDAKPYVVAALELGFADENIRFVDVGTGGLTLEQLAARNAHGVTLERITKMVNKHTGQGEMTLKKVLEAKEKPKKEKILYSAVVLDKASHNKLVERFGNKIPDNWTVYTHHMTIVFGKGLDNEEEIGREVALTVTKLGLSDMAMAVQVEGYPSKNVIPHITIAVNPDGGKPVMSNDISKWQDVKKFRITGIVTEIKT